MIDPNHDAFDLPQDRITQAVAHAEANLRGLGFTITDLQPGDGTAYKMVVARAVNLERYEAEVNRHPAQRINHLHHADDYYFVSCSLAGQYEWPGYEIGEPGYVESKWFSRIKDPNPWTVIAIFRFLNALAARLDLQLEEVHP